MNTENLITVRVAVSCVNSNGEEDFYFCKVVCAEEEYDSGLHYNFAKEACENEGYEAVLAYDEVGCPRLMTLFHWASADYIGPIGKPVSNRPKRRPHGAPDITVEEMKDKDWWGEHPGYPRKVWREEVSVGNTQLGYWEWAEARRDESAPV